MSQSIVFMCAPKKMKKKVPGLNHLYILKKKSKYIYGFNHLHWKRTDNVTFSPEVIELMIDHSNDNQLEVCQVQSQNVL